MRRLLFGVMSIRRANLPIPKKNPANQLNIFMSNIALQVREAPRGTFEWLLLNHHYAKRVPSISFAYGLYDGDTLIGVVTFGSPPSRHLQMSACKSNPDCVIELNRLCILDHAPANSASFFLAKALGMLPARIVVSYADTVQGHLGFVYRAANFKYAGWTDMERKTPRYDYVTPGKHSRDAFRLGAGLTSEKVRRRPKIKYWTITGTRLEKHTLSKVVTWSAMSWKDNPPPLTHRTIDNPVNIPYPPQHEI